MIAMNMSMTERIKAGKLFTDMCEGLPEKRLRGKTLMYEFNHSHPSEVEKRECRFNLSMQHPFQLSLSVF
ncbi:galactoside O-acetyltransferase [Escherichia coli]|nr:galactoside O-acetyltransferase [Escherichia coli]